MPTRAIIVHSLDDARAAASAAAELGVPVTLASAPGATAYLGAPWFRALARIIREEYPRAEVRVLLDCGDKAGHVLAALRAGVTRVRFAGRKAAEQRLRALAEEYGAELITGRLRALDLLDEADPRAACRRWLAEP